MPKKKKTLTTAIGVVVDESASMLIRAEETRSAFNSYFDDIEKEDETAVVTAATFSDVGRGDKVRYLCRNTPVTDMPYLDENNYVPNGMTPLFDAVGQVIMTLGNEKADRYLVVILTDGAENASKEYNRFNIQSLITSKEQSDKWTFVFIGAGIDAWSGAQNLGISTPGTSFSYSGEKGTTHDTVAVASASTRSYLGSTKTSFPDFFSEEKKVKS
jgi:hypothetical protein